MSKDPYPIPTEKILERLRFEDPWWKTQEIDPSGLSNLNFGVGAATLSVLRDLRFF